MIKIIINHFHRVRYEAVNRIKYLKDQNSNATLNIRADFLLLQTVQLERTKHSKSRTNQRPSFWILCPPSKKKRFQDNKGTVCMTREGKSEQKT